MSEKKVVVRCGCLGCLTDDCEHWNDLTCKPNFKTNEPDYCLLDRIISVTREVNDTTN